MIPSSLLITLITTVILFLNVPIQAKLKKQQVQQLLILHCENRTTFFCEQPFDSQGTLFFKQEFDYLQGSQEIQWMPIIPISKLANHLPCYQNKLCLDNHGRAFKGIRCCEKTNPYFIQMYNDYFNYVPENPILIKLRKNKELTKIISAPSHRCRFDDPKKISSCHPSHEIRGWIARTYLYFYLQYQIPLTSEELALFQQWNIDFPVSEWERKRAHLISQLQGMTYPFIFAS